jgi:hypothetical protein
VARPDRDVQFRRHYPTSPIKAKRIAAKLNLVLMVRLGPGNRRHYNAATAFQDCNDDATTVLNALDQPGIAFVFPQEAEFDNVTLFRSNAFIQ